MTSKSRWMAVGILLTVAGCGGTDTVPEPVRPVRAMRIGDAPEITGRSFPGTAESVDAVQLSFRVGGPLVAFPANELGKRVSQGNLLAQIDPRDFEVKVREAQAALARARSELDAMRQSRPEDIEKLKAEVVHAEAKADYARAEYNRNRQAFQGGGISSSELELSAASAKLAEAELVQAKVSLDIGEKGSRPEDIKAKESEIESLQASVQKAQDELADTKLVAPFDGAISVVYVENFEVVQPKQPVVRLVNTADLEIRVDIPENLIALIPSVTDTFVTIQSYPDKPIPARVAEIGTEPSPVTRTYPVKLRFSPPTGIDVRPGMTGVVRGRSDSKALASAAGQVVPTTAVFESEEGQQVWIYDSAAKSVAPRKVQVLGITPFGVNISGVEPGEWIVTAGVHYLREGQTVRLLSDELQQQQQQESAE